MHLTNSLLRALLAAALLLGLAAPSLGGTLTLTYQLQDVQEPVPSASGGGILSIRLAATGLNTPTFPAYVVDPNFEVLQLTNRCDGCGPTSPYRAIQILNPSIFEGRYDLSSETWKVSRPGNFNNILSFNWGTSFSRFATRVFEAYFIIYGSIGGTGPLTIDFFARSSGSTDSYYHGFRATGQEIARSFSSGVPEPRLAPLAAAAAVSALAVAGLVRRRRS
ncbi:MAG: hypothetical protein QNK05_14095 [Myxococcota bacterium]|nr:hypothetical protein [Myxococcota bacterium]